MVQSNTHYHMKNNTSLYHETLRNWKNNIRNNHKGTLHRCIFKLFITNIVNILQRKLKKNFQLSGCTTKIKGPTLFK